MIKNKGTPHTQIVSHLGYNHDGCTRRQTKLCKRLVILLVAELLPRVGHYEFEQWPPVCYILQTKKQKRTKYYSVQKSSFTLANNLAETPRCVCVCVYVSVRACRAWNKTIIYHRRLEDQCSAHPWDKLSYRLESDSRTEGLGDGWSIRQSELNTRLITGGKRHHTQ